MLLSIAFAAGSQHPLRSGFKSSIWKSRPRLWSLSSDATEATAAAATPASSWRSPTRPKRLRIARGACLPKCTVTMCIPHRKLNRRKCHEHPVPGPPRRRRGVGLRRRAASTSCRRPQAHGTGNRGAPLPPTRRAPRARRRSHGGNSRRPRVRETTAAAERRALWICFQALAVLGHGPQVIRAPRGSGGEGRGLTGRSLEWAAGLRRRADPQPRIAVPHQREY